MEYNRVDTNSEMLIARVPCGLDEVSAEVGQSREQLKEQMLLFPSKEVSLEISAADAIVASVSEGD